MIIAIIKVGGIASSLSTRHITNKWSLQHNLDDGRHQMNVAS